MSSWLSRRPLKPIVDVTEIITSSPVSKISRLPLWSLLALAKTAWDCFSIQVSLIFQMFVLGHFTLTKDLYEYLCSLTESNSKRIFTFMKKGEQWKQWSVFVLQGVPAEAVHPEKREETRRHRAPSLGTTLGISSSNRHGSALCLWASVLLLPRCIPRYQKCLASYFLGLGMLKKFSI